jgi:chaperone modulatory protein CbpM
MTTAPDTLTVYDLSRTCAVQVQFIIELVHEGVLIPLNGTDHGSWRFGNNDSNRIRVAWRLHRDLGVNLPGAALALELLEALEQASSHGPMFP